MEMHDNSLRAYDELQPELTGRRGEIYAVYESAGHAMTDREVMEALGHRDMNAVRPRITELIQAGALAEVDSVPCSVSGKRVRLTALPENSPNPTGQLLLF